MKANQLKALQRQLTDGKKAKEKLEAELQVITAKLSAWEKEIEELCDSKDVVISEHALLRYLERVMGIDMTQVQDQIFQNQRLRKNRLQSFNSVFEGHKYVVKNNTLVTVEPA